MKLIAEAPECFYLPLDIVDMIYEQACEGTPREACGMLGGRHMTVAAQYPVTNHADNYFLYEVDPLEAFEVVKQMRDDDMSLIASWHSHPESVAYPSFIDVSKATDPNLIYVIVSLLPRENNPLRAFNIVDKEIEEIPIISE